MPDRPYDRELEYLESTGTQYIDTDIAISYPNDDSYVSAEVSFTNTASTRQLMGWNWGAWVGMSANSATVDGTTASLPLNEWHTLETNVTWEGSTSTKVKKLDGSVISTATSEASGTASLYLRVFALDTTNGHAANFFCRAKLRKFSAKLNDVLVLDLIPVLKDGVGYMYDKVSGTLFGNAGTGSFVLGPYADRVPLPSYAKRIEYLESTGTQWIDTGIVPTDTTGVEAVLTICSDNGTDNVPFGARMDSGHTRFLEDIDWGNSDSIGWGFGTYSAVDARCSLTGKAGAVVTTSINFHNDRRGRVDGVDYDTSLETKSLPSITCPIYICAIDFNGTAQHQYTGRIYRVTITSGSAIVRSFVPCRILDTGYLWDEVEGKFYGNQGTGDFVLGPDVREGVVPTRLNPFGVGRRMEEIRRVEYLESTGTQYIDTGLNADSGLGCDMSMAFPDASMNGNYTFGVLKRTGNTYVRYHASFLTSGSPNLNLFLGGGTVIVAGVAASPGTGDWHRFTYDPQAQTASVDNSSGSTSGLGAWDAGMDVTLFGRQDSNGTLGLSRIRVRYAKFYRSGSLVQDFVPVAIGSVGYLLDRVSGRLFGNQGTGDFVVGPDIVPVEYVESTGAQYVDTRAEPTSDIVVETSFMRTWETSGTAIFGKASFDGGTVLRLYGNTINRAGYDAAHSAAVPVDTKWHVVRSSATETIVDGVSKSGNFSGNFAPGSLFIFAQRASMSAANVLSRSRISYFRLYMLGSLVRDFQPVRVGTEGALYDRVTDTVFRSATSTPLVAGPDIPA